MKRNRLEKGNYGYFKQKRMDEILKTILMFAVSLSLLFAGYNVSGTKANVLTVVAVLGMLPASKSAVSMIMYLRYHGCSRELFDKLSETTDKLENVQHAYDLVFTTYKVTYEVPSIVVKNGNVCGFCERKNCDLNELNKHISQILSQNGLKSTVKIFDNFDTYLNRVRQLEAVETGEETKDKEVMHILHQISL